MSLRQMAERAAREVLEAQCSNEISETVVADAIELVAKAFAERALRCARIASVNSEARMTGLTDTQIDAAIAAAEKGQP